MSLHCIRLGRFYAELGVLLAGSADRNDRGVAQGAHGGLAPTSSVPDPHDEHQRALLWMQRNDPSNRNAFIVQVGASLSPRLEHQASH